MISWRFFCVCAEPFFWESVLGTQCGGGGGRGAGRRRETEHIFSASRARRAGHGARARARARATARPRGRPPGAAGRWPGRAAPKSAKRAAGRKKHVLTMFHRVHTRARMCTQCTKKGCTFTFIIKDLFISYRFRLGSENQEGKTDNHNYEVDTWYSRSIFQERFTHSTP